MFELRLEGGKRYFWSPVPTVFGHLRALRVPEFCTQADFPGRCGEGTRGIWDAWPIDEGTRFQHLGPDRGLCRPVEISARTPGVALISFAHKTGTGRRPCGYSCSFPPPNRVRTGGRCSRTGGGFCAPRRKI